jgi:tripartite-type tricarboxylate transporter receptor subunit TctC
MFNKILTKLVIAVATLLPITAQSQVFDQSKIVVLSPFRQGGSTMPFLKEFSDELSKHGVTADLRFLGNCRLADHTLNNSTDKHLYLWSSVIKEECPRKNSLLPSNFIGMINWSPTYFCGRHQNLDHYRSNSAVIGTSSGVVNRTLSEQLRDKINPNIRVVQYANSGAVRTALIAGEIDLVVTNLGKVMEQEKLVTCYAATSTQRIGNINTVSSIIGKTSFSEFSDINWISAVNFSSAEIDAIRKIYNAWVQTSGYKALMNAQAREWPPESVTQQISEIENSLN